MIYFITSRSESYNWKELAEDEIVEASIDEFVHWAAHQKEAQLDTETTVVEGPDEHQDREMLVLQLGSMDGEDQWIFDIVDLSDDWLSALEFVLRRTDITFYIHNAKFDILVIHNKFRFILNSVHDTFLMSKVLNTGLELPAGYHSLAGCLDRFFDFHMDKTDQTTFTREPHSKRQIMYAAIDVMFLGDLAAKLKELLDSFQLWYIYDTVEREVVKVYAEMEVTPMRFDAQQWLSVAKTLEDDRDKLLIELNKSVLADPKLVAMLSTDNNAIGQALIQPHDEFKVSWNSTTQRKLFLGKLVPSLPSDCTTKPAIKKWFKDNEESLSMDEIDHLNYFMDRDYDSLNDVLVSQHKQWLIDNGMYIPKGTILINWNSNPHKLAVFNFYYPDLVDTNSKSLNRITKNDIITHFKKYVSAQKRVTSYGESFLEKYVRRDGLVCPNNCSQILNTGRIAFGILLQIPSEARFRNAFLPPTDDDVFVDSDFSSAELVIMSFAAGEEAFLNAIRDKRDLHCMSASLIFGDKWINAAEPDCTWMIDGSQCTCPEHQKLRKKSKAISFGLAYGLTYHGLAERLDIPKAEAQSLIARFFEVFPRLKQLFEDTGNSAMQNLYVRSLMPTGRIRFFAEPEHKGEREAIGREGKNYPIQETNATILKIALINLSKEIKSSGIRAKIHLPVHDEILSSCHKDDQDKLVEMQERCMIAAGELFLGKGLLGVDTKVLTKWTK